MLWRLKAVALACLILFGYFWTGAVAKLWLLNSEPRGYPMPADLHARAFRGQPLLGVNAGFKAFMSVYGPVPLGPLLGPGTGTFLRGLGAGLDPADESYDERRRQALERNVHIRPFNPWRGHARLELAALDAFPRPLAETMSVVRPDESLEPAWVTVSLVDQDRWWITRQPTGPNVPHAEQLCTEALSDMPSEAVAAQALSLRASLAAERWDFRAEAADLKELVLDHPASPLAESALGVLAQDAAMAGRPDEAASFYRHVMRARLPAERPRLAIGLAALQAQAGDVESARATLREAQHAVDRAAAASGSQGRDSDLDRKLRDWLRSLEGRRNAPTPPPSAPPGPGAPIRTRLLAAGRPIAGVVVALVPLADAFQSLPPPAGFEAASPRPAGAFPAPARRVFGMGQQSPRWNTPAMVSRLKRRPSLLSRSDARGEVRWLSTPPGAYALLIRAGTWQLPNRGRDLAPVPTRFPVVVTGSEQVIPDVRFTAPIRLTPGPRAAPVRSVRWRPVAGAAHYRVVLRDSTAEQSLSPEAAETGAASPGIDPQIIWWRDGLTGTAAQLTPAQFVGPASDPARSGLLGGRAYAWSVEAMGRDGNVLATSESLAGPVTFGARTWTALRPPPEANSRRARRPAFFEPGGGPPAGPAGFTSPFLESLIRGGQPAAIRIVERPLLPRIDSNGQGLPPRPPLRIEHGTPPFPPFGDGMPPRLPPQLLARLRGQMPPQGGGPPPGLPPQLLARLQREPPPPGFGFGPGNAPPRLTGANGRITGRVAPWSIASVPVDAAGRPLPGKPPLFSADRRLPGASAMRRAPEGDSAIPRRPAPTRRPAGAPGLPAQSRHSEPLSIELEPFGPGSESRWRSDERGALPEASLEGLPVEQKVMLHPAFAPLALPPGTHRVVLHLKGGRTEVELRLRDSGGTVRTIQLTSPAEADSWLAAPTPAGSWSLLSLALSPPVTGSPRLSALTAEVDPDPGAYATAWKQGNLLLVRIYNLGEAGEHLALESAPATALAEADLAPRGQAQVRIQLSAFPGGTPPSSLSLNWTGGRMTVPVE